jgi:hypothetical protein
MLLEQSNMLNHIASKIKNCVPASIRFEIRQKRAQLAHFFASLRFWQWQHAKFPLSESNPTTIHYKGRLQNKPVLMALLGVDATTTTQINEHTNSSANEVYVTEHPMRDAICIPFALITIVKLGRSIEDIVASYSKSLRRSINSERPNYRYHAIDEIDKVDAIESSMLRPYASARHDIGAAQLQSGLVRRFAQKAHGRLDVLLQGDEEVGCHLGNPYTRKGKRYWHVNRLGYPQTVFSDYKRWGEVNSMNLHLALEAAIANGYDYCDYGVSLAKPGHGLIEWKRRRRGFLATHDNFKYFYLKLPKTGGAQFLWESPVFGVEGGKPTLHLGVPEGKTDEELLARYHEMGYAGLYKVYLDCVKPPSAQFIESIRTLYADQETQPLVITYIVG